MTDPIRTVDPAQPDLAPLALVTGASSGIGQAIAAELADRGFDLVLAAHEPELQTAAAQLAAGGGGVQAVQVDLSTREGVEELHRAVQATGRPLHAAVLNAGIGVHGRFDQTDLEGHLRLVDLNVRSVVHLAHLVLQDMVARGEGHVLVTASVAAKAPGPWQTTYAASKAFDHVFAEGLREELKDTGVSVTSLLPGPVETPFWDRADMRDTRVGAGPKDSPERVAEEGVDAMLDGDDEVFGGGLKTAIQVAVSGLVPDRLLGKVAGAATKPDSA
jgi:short-subunit dehydrogenase